MQGKFITFEGGEGSGKSTQIRLLAKRMRECAIPFIQTKEPGGTKIGAQIRGILLNSENTSMTAECELLLYLADRAQDVRERVLPETARGTWVLGDRYHDSTLAYQGAARGLDPALIEPIFQLATGGLRPDLTFLLDVEVELGLERAQRRNEESGLEASEGRFEAEQLRFHLAVREHFLALARKEPERWVVLSGAEPPKLIAEKIWFHLSNRLEVFHVR